jgi:hypothetical protein
LTLHFFSETYFVFSRVRKEIAVEVATQFSNAATKSMLIPFQVLSVNVKPLPKTSRL